MTGRAGAMGFRRCAVLRLLRCSYRQQQDCANDKAGCAADGLRHVIEICAKLISQQGRNDDERDQDQHPVGLKPRERTRNNIGQDADRDASAVEWRQGETC